MKANFLQKYGFLLTIIFLLNSKFSNAQLQTVYPNNASFNYAGFITGVPNHLTPTLWNRVRPNTTPDVSKTGLTNYGVFMSPEYNSTDGEPWLRCIDLPNYRGNSWVEGVYTTVTGLVPGRTYNVKFEQSIISAKIKMDGRWNVSLDNQIISAPWMTAPTAPFSMAPWQNITLGPFVATGSTMVFKLEAEAKTQAVPNGWNGCDLALDGVYLEGINTPPVANDDNISVCTGIPNGTSVTTVVASDLDGDVLTYSIVSGNTGGAFAINSSTGEITVANSAQVTAGIPFSLVIQVDDPYGGTDNCTITITSGATITYNTITTIASCLLNASITVNVTSGIGPFEYSNDGGATFQTSNIFNNLSGGTYKIMVKNATSCPVPQDVIITTVAPFTIDNVGGIIGCDGTKSIDINISGGTGPWTYELNNLTWHFNNLVPGINTARVIDGGTGCVVEQNFIATVPDPVTIDNIITTDVTCTASGSITVTPGDGLAPFTYSKDGGTIFQGSNIFNSLAATTYSIVVKDANGCTASQNVIINTIPPFTLDSVVPLDLTCGSKGAINIYTQGGSSVEYSINNGSDYQSSGSFPGLEAGNYDIIVRDGNGCQTTQNVVLINTPVFVLDGFPTNVTCAGLGTITIDVSAPTATMEYSIDSGLNFQDTNFFTDLAAGTYDLMIRDHNSCFNVQTVNVINVPGFIVDSVSKTDVTCNSLGSITLAASGGTNPIRYSINNGSNFFNSGNFPNLTAGSYDIIIEDANTCNHKENIIINNIVPVSIDTINTTDETCSAGGSITVNTTGGTNPIEFSKDGGLTFQSSNIFIGLTAGTYNIVVRDGNTCSSSQNVIINNIPSFTINSVSTTDATCITLGTIDVNVTGGTPPYLYSIDGVNFQVSSTFNNLIGGNYTITINDDNGCSQTQNATINIISPFNLDAISTTDETCSILGSISISASGGTPPIEYSIDGGSNFVTVGNFPNLNASSYNIIIRDGSGCSVNQIVNINEILPPVIDSIVTIGDSCGACQGELVIFASGGTNPIIYSHDGGSTFQNNINFTNLCASTYNLQINDGNGCIINANSQVLNLGTPADATINSVVPLCAEGDPIQLTANSNGGIWSGNNVTSTGLFNPLAPGSYVITYSISGVCGDSDQTTIVVEENPIIQVTSNANNTCSNTEVTISYTSTVPLNNCLWDFGDGTSDSICSITTHSYDQVGCYDITVRGDSPTGCRAKKVETDFVCVNPDPTAAFEPSETIVKVTYPNILFNNLSQNAVSYNWDFAGLDSSTSVNPSYKFPSEVGNYNICLEATSQYGCKDFICHEIYVEEEILINVPNAFTPNGDGVNDLFKAVLKGFGEKPLFYMQIWNRWGEQVFQTTDAFESWTGVVDNDSPVSNTFVWKIFAKDYKGNDHNLIGHVFILK